MKRIFFIAIFFVIIISAAYYFINSQTDVHICEKRVPAPKIIAFGDSLVEGKGATQKGGFVTLLSHKAGVPITNLGVSGDTSADAEARVNDVLTQKPDITIVLLGGNDAIQHISQVDTEKHLEGILQQLQKSKSHILLLGVIGGFPDPYASMYEHLARTYNADYVSNVLSGILGHSDLLSDEIHPNQQGYQIIADRVLPVLEQACRER